MRLHARLRRTLELSFELTHPRPTLREQPSCCNHLVLVSPQPSSSRRGLAHDLHELTRANVFALTSCSDVTPAKKLVKITTSQGERSTRHAAKSACHNGALFDGRYYLHGRNNEKGIRRAPSPQTATASCLSLAPQRVRNSSREPPAKPGHQPQLREYPARPRKRFVVCPQQTLCTLQLRGLAEKWGLHSQHRRYAHRTKEAPTVGRLL